MKKFLSLIITLLPVSALAQNLSVRVPDDTFAYASIFSANFSSLLSIVIGMIATVIVFRSAKKLGGGLFGSVLNYIGIGIAFIVFGTIAAVVDPWYVGLGFNIASTVLFALGYIFAVIGANKLLKGIMST